MVPSAKLRQTSRTKAADVLSSASPSTPDRNGRSSRSTTGPRSPAAARSWAAERSMKPAVRAGGAASTRAVQAASLALSSGGSSPSVAVRQSSSGLRSGWANTCSRPSSPRMAAPELERPQVQGVEIGGGPQRRVGGVEHLEAAVAAEAVDHVGGHPPTRPVGRVQQQHVETAGAEQPGGAQPGQPGPDHDDD